MRDSDRVNIDVDHPGTRAGRTLRRSGAVGNALTTLAGRKEAERLPVRYRAATAPTSPPR